MDSSDTKRLWSHLFLSRGALVKYPCHLMRTDGSPKMIYGVIMRLEGDNAIIRVIAVDGFHHRLYTQVEAIRNLQPWKPRKNSDAYHRVKRETAGWE